MRLIVKKDHAEMTAAAFEAFTEHLERSPVLGFATGSTPKLLYEHLVAAFRAGKISFDGKTAFVLDEYSGIPAGHPESYQYFMRTNLFNHVDIPQSKLHFPDTRMHERLAARRYSEEISRYGPIDFQILGIGQNGHIGFNEPGSEILSRVRSVDLAEETIRLNSPPSKRALTMGIADILETRTILLMASGASKADALQEAFRGPQTRNVPASFLQDHPHLIVVADEAAAKHL